MVNEHLSLSEIKMYIEELKKSKVSRNTIDNCFGVYHTNITRTDIGLEDKVCLCIMNGLAHMRIGSYLSAESNYLLARSYANEHGDRELLKEVGFEIIFFYANSKEWVLGNRPNLLLELSKFKND